MNTIFLSMLSMAGLGLFFASILAVANRKLKIKEDPKVEAIENVLSGINCGACGFTSCLRYAQSLAKGESEASLCRAGGREVINELSNILGIKVKEKTKEVAIVHCGADTSKRKKKAVYSGIQTCQASHNLFGGEVLCAYGCLGFGDCKSVCPFGAIILVNGLPKVDKEKCTACGKCVEACPRKIISVEKMFTDNFLYVACSNRDKGPDTRKACSVGCIACGMCARLSGGAFYVDKMLADVHSEKIKNISNPEEVVKKCPTKCIAKLG